MLVPLRELLRETDMKQASIVYCEKCGIDEQEDVLAAECLAVGIKKYAESSTEDKTSPAMMLDLSNLSDSSPIRRIANKRNTMRFLYLVNANGNLDLEFVSSKVLNKFVKDGIMDSSDIDAEKASVGDLIRACKRPSGTPLLLTPISQVRDFTVWIDDDLSEDEFKDAKANIMACLMQSVAMFGKDIDSSEITKQFVYQQMAKEVASIGVIHPNADELFNLTTKQSDFEDLQIDEIRGRIETYNSRLNSYKQISREAQLR